MRNAKWIVLFALTTLLSCITAPAVAIAQQYVPSVGQEGKDVIWVPTPDELVRAMLDMAKVTSDDFVIDLGSGDGRIVIAAAKRGARAMGIEYNPDMVELSKRNAEAAGVNDKASFVAADLFASDFSAASVITMYLLPELNLKLRPIILNLKPGTRVVSHAFTMGDWAADQTALAQGSSAYLWIVPAKVEGVWTWKGGSGAAELPLTQTFQTIKGALKIDGKELPLRTATLEGSFITLAVGDLEYSGRISGSTIEGIVKAGGREEKWSATRR